MDFKGLLFFALLLSGLLLVSCSKGGSAITTGSVVDFENNPTKLSEAACTDSDGKDTTVKGTATGTYDDGTAFELSDGCHAGFLVEYYCEGDVLQNFNVRCPGRCSGGMCVSAV